MDTIGTLFGSSARVKILRLFLSNPLEIFSAADVAQKSKVKLSEARKELALIKDAGVIAGKSFFREISVKRGSKKAVAKKRLAGFQLKPGFRLLTPLKNFVFAETPFDRSEIVRRFRAAGNLKLLVLAGVFIDADDSRVDVLIVGDRLKRRAIETILRSIEAEVGKELSYSALETADFLYRVSMYDKFVRDVLDFRHDRVIDKLGVE